MIILLNGKAKSGKDTVADFLVKNYLYEKVSFAGLLKDAVHTIFSITQDEINDKEEILENWDQWSPRKLYQFVGTELFRTQFSPDVWAKTLWISKLKNNLDRDFVISDLRFQNELDFFNPYLDIVDVSSIKIIRPGFDGNVGFNKHASETDSVTTDHTIMNDSTLFDLYDSVTGIMNEINR